MTPEAVRIHGDVRSAVRRGLPRGPVPFGLSALFVFRAGHTAGGAFILELGRSIPFVPGVCAAFDPVRRDPVRLSLVAKLGRADGPVAGALVVSEDRFAPAIFLSLGLAIAALAS